MNSIEALTCHLPLARMERLKIALKLDDNAASTALINRSFIELIKLAESCSASTELQRYLQLKDRGLLPLTQLQVLIVYSND